MAFGAQQTFQLFANDWKLTLWSHKSYQDKTMAWGGTMSATGTWPAIDSNNLTLGQDGKSYNVKDLPLKVVLILGAEQRQVGAIQLNWADSSGPEPDHVLITLWSSVDVDVSTLSKLNHLEITVTEQDSVNATYGGWHSDGKSGNYVLPIPNYSLKEWHLKSDPTPPVDKQLAGLQKSLSHLWLGLVVIGAMMVFKMFK
jgi:hypothetical protein